MTFAEYELKNFGYVVITDYYEQLSSLIFVKDVMNKYNELLEDASSDYKKLTELVIVLNRLAWAFYHKKNYNLSQVYSDLYYKAHNLACDTLKGEEFDYYFNITD